MLAWQQFLEQRGVPTRDGGKHEILVHCPFCGQGDPSQHLSINLHGRGWRCLRNKAHAGRSYARLLAMLISCSEEYARDLLGERARVLPSDDEFNTTWRRQLGMESQVVERPQRINLPDEARPLLNASGRVANACWDHLYQRGYDHNEASWIVKMYRLLYAKQGFWSYRLIIPVYSSTGELMTWVGRSVAKDADRRYLNLPAEQSVETAPNLVLGLDFLWLITQPRCLVITEGPFDAMAISALGHHDGIWGTCLFGVQVSSAQAVLLSNLARRFERLRLLVDPDARMKVLAFRDRLPSKCQIRELAAGIKDPGELPLLKEHALEHVQSLI